MNTKNIDLVNIGLMLFSCILAFVLPFELFLFSYAVLGPLHYLTEISWLHKRNYFANGKNDYIWLIFIASLLIFFSSCAFANSQAGSQFAFLRAPLAFLCDLMGPLVDEFPNANNFLIYLSFASALAFIAFNDFMPKMLFIMAAIFVGIMIKSTQPFFLIFAVFLPTLIHVFVFTGLFILQGALKNKSATGVASLVVFILCALSFFVVYPHFSFYSITNYAQKALTDSGFVNVNRYLMLLFNKETESVFTSNIGFGVMRFIAFAYTYHYLNWFSKTQIIKWHQVPKRQLAFVIVLWIASVALYAVNYFVGLVALYFLSMLHVLLEFPLNYRSFIGIGHELRLLGGGKKPKPAAAKR
jgi:hypothetical protein